MSKSFIEMQFPVSKISKESYKERKAGAGQTLTGLGKWWGRKPLILVRATILGCLMPASDNPEKDREIFLKILSMDEDGLALRKDKSISTNDLYYIIHNHKYLRSKYSDCFRVDENGKISLVKASKRKDIERDAFRVLGYDKKITMCVRPEHLDNISEKSWAEINEHLGTNAHSLAELINELSMKRYGHLVRVGDCFCGGGSIPFEAARMGCEAYGSDLNPVAAMLTWADINLCGASKDEMAAIDEFRRKVFEDVQRQIDDLGVETNEVGDKAVAYLYCEEAVCPECGHRVPLAPSWVIGMTSKTIIQLIDNGSDYLFDVQTGASSASIKKADHGTITKNGMLCPCCGKTTPLSAIRHDQVDNNGDTVYGLRQWGKEEFESRPDDVFHERLYAIKYERPDGTRYYRAPNVRDKKNEDRVRDIVKKNLSEWQSNGVIPSMEIESGYNTSQLIRERGWKYWHQMFNARQLLLMSLFIKSVMENARTKKEYSAGYLGINKTLDKNAKLCYCLKDDKHGISAPVFYNQALNPVYNYVTLGLSSLFSVWFYNVNNALLSKNNKVLLNDARSTSVFCDLWITDPPYADAVNYHELTEFFLAWDKALIPRAFPEWYTDSKRILAVRGDESFSHTMIDIYKNLTDHMSDDGLQVVMFTHSDPSVWAQLALIMWKAGLTVTAAWNIATETESGGLKNGNYVKGTVLLVLRKQTSSEEAFLDELNADIKNEVKNQIDYMQNLDDKEDPNFSDPDYILAAYAASLRVLTSYKSIGEINLDYELNLAINDPSKSEVVKLIERAKKIAYDSIIPGDFDHYLWRELSPAERFYIKGLEAEKHGNYQISTYQEYARGFGLANYSQLMAKETANVARLKTPSEFGMRTVGIPAFEQSILRLVLAAIHVGIKEDMNPNMGLYHIKNNLDGYWT